MAPKKAVSAKRKRLPPRTVWRKPATAEPPAAEPEGPPAKKKPAKAEPANAEPAAADAGAGPEARASWFIAALQSRCSSGFVEPLF